MSETMETVVEQTDEATVTEPPAEETSTGDAVPTDEGVGAENTDSADAQDGGVQTAPSTEQRPAEGDGAYFMPIYKGEVVAIKADNREEITSLLQMGMKYRDSVETMDKLDELAQACGYTSVKEFVEKSMQSFDEQELQQAIADYGEKKGRQFHEYQKGERARNNAKRREDTANAESAQNKSIEERLADQFKELKAMHPTVGDFSAVPKKVIEQALCDNISLVDAYNRHLITQQRAVDTAAAKAREAAKASTGSMVNGNETADSPEREAFLSGLYSV